MQAADALKLKAKQDDFETCVIEIGKADYDNFIEKLTEKWSKENKMIEIKKDWREKRNF